MSERARLACSEDDLLQATWAEATRRIGSFESRGPTSFQKWLAAILRNNLLHAERCDDRLRARPVANGDDQQE